MPFVPACDKEGTKNREGRTADKGRARQNPAPGTQPSQSNQTVAYEVATFADVVVDDIPPTLGHVTKERFIDLADGACGVVGSHHVRRFAADHGNGQRNRPPCGDPKGGLRLATRHDFLFGHESILTGGVHAHSQAWPIMASRRPTR